MKTSELRQIIYACTNGAPELRQHRVAEFRLKLSQEVARLRDKAAGQCAEFRSRREAWTSTRITDIPRPLTIEQDWRDARMIKLIAWILTITELVLTFFLAIVFGIPPLFLLLLAAVAIFALKAGLLATWHNEMQPQETRRRLRNFIIVPSLTVTMLAATALILARGVGGALALLLLPFLNLALCALSLGCLGLAAGLFALSYLLSWSRYAELQFNEVERKAIETLRTLRQVEKIAEELSADKPASLSSVALVSPAALQDHTAQVSSPLSEQSQAMVKGGVSLLPLLLLFAFQSASCSWSGDRSAAAGASESAQAKVKAEQHPAMEVWLDWSLSAEAEAYRQAVKSLIGALPEVIARHQMDRFTAYQFGGNGWNATELLSLDLPALPQAETGEAGELFGQVKKEQERQTRQHFAVQLRERLTDITEAKLLPGKVGEPKCTDLQGVLSRIAEGHSQQRRLVVLLTDGDDTCSGRLKPVSLPTSEVALLIILLPEQSRGTRHSLSFQGWEETKAKLARTLTSAIIIPHFADPGSAISQAMTVSTRSRSE